jgi:hypothetical protein
MTEYPEHEKLREKIQRSEASQKIGEFFNNSEYVLARRHEHTDGCFNEHGGFESKICGFEEGDLQPVHKRPAQIAGMILNIDEQELEQEKREMLETIREQNNEDTE